MAKSEQSKDVLDIAEEWLHIDHSGTLTFKVVCLLREEVVRLRTLTTPQQEPEGETRWTDEQRRALFAEPMDPPGGMPLSDEEMRRLPSILRLGCGHESSIGTRLMRAAADEIDRLRSRVQPRTVSEEEWEDIGEEAAICLMEHQGGPGTPDRFRASLVMSIVAARLGIQITPSEERDDGQD